MNIEITGKHMSITDALRNHTTKKVTKAFDHIVDKPPICRVVLGHVKHEHYAELTVHWSGQELNAAATASGDMYIAIDEASNKLRRQLDQVNKRQHAHR